MKIIAVDNFDRENKSDQLIAEGLTPTMATFICKALQEKYGGESASSFFKVVEDGHKLFKFEP